VNPLPKEDSGTAEHGRVLLILIAKGNRGLPDEQPVIGKDVVWNSKGKHRGRVRREDKCADLCGQKSRRGNVIMHSTLPQGKALSVPTKSSRKKNRTGSAQRRI